MEIIVISTSNYKEKDSILSAISENGVETFLVKGLQDPKSKNIVLASPLVIADVEITEGNYKYPIIKSSKVITSPYKLNDSLEKLASISLISEASRLLLPDEEKASLYKWLKEAVLAIKEEKMDIYLISLIYLAQILKIAGYEFNVRECVYCGSHKDIISFSFEEGGYVCKNCFDDELPREFDVPQMKLIRNVFLAKDFSPINGFTKEDELIIIKHFADYIYDGLGIKLKSIDLFI